MQLLLTDEREDVAIQVCTTTLQHTATHYNTLQHTATHCNSPLLTDDGELGSNAGS